MTRVEHSSVKMDWQTPDAFLDKVRLVFPQGIHYDPCTVEENPVRATHYDTPETDGLSRRDWPGAWYCNPPYGRELPRWTNHICGQTSTGILLVPSRTDTRWFHKVWIYADAVCLMKGRLKFKGATAFAPFPSAVFYFGMREHIFANVFRDDGIVIIL